MTELRIRVQVGDVRNVGRGVERSFRNIREQVQANARAAINEATEEILRRGRADISSAGRFGSRWTEGLQAIQFQSKDETSVTIIHTIPYWTVFQKGATIRGRPLLWIPLSFAGDAQGVNARDYPGGLFRVDRKGGLAPLLLSRTDKQPKYFGKSQVRIPKKFHLVEIARDVARNLRSIYNRIKGNG